MFGHHEIVCKEMFELFRGEDFFLDKLKLGGDGEWEWIGKKYREDIRRKIVDERDFSDLFTELETFPFSRLSFGMVTFSDEDDVRNSDDLGPLPIGAWRDYLLLQRLVRKGAHLRDFDWPELLRVNLARFRSESASGWVLEDSFRHSYFASLVLELMSNCESGEVLEVGGGYGGFALQIQRLKRVDWEVRHTIVDLPESLFLSYWFLRMQGMRVTVVLDEDSFAEVPPAGIVLIPDYLYENFPWKPDVLFNSRSFSEMSAPTATAYLKHADAVLKPNNVVLEATGYDLFPDSLRHKEQIAESLLRNLPSYRLLASQWSPWLGGGGRYFEYTLSRDGVKLSTWDDHDGLVVASSS